MVVSSIVFAGGDECMVVASFVVYFGIGFLFIMGSASLNDLSSRVLFVGRYRYHRFVKIVHVFCKVVIGYEWVVVFSEVLIEKDVFEVCHQDCRFDGLTIGREVAIKERRYPDYGNVRYAPYGTLISSSVYFNQYHSISFYSILSYRCGG